MKEIWQDIPSYDGRYQASTLGRIRNTERIINQWSYETRGRKQYLRCAINGKPKLVHRLIALTFLPNPGNKTSVDHIDFNEQNNRVDNLRWVTVKENQQNSSGRMRNKKTGEDHYRAILTNQQWEEARRLKALGVSYAKTARRYGVDPNLLHAMIYRERKYAKRPKKIGET